MLDHLLRRHLPPPLFHAQQQRPLLPLGVRHPYHRSLRYGLVPHRRVLQVDGAHPLAAALDDVFRPVDDLHAAVGVQRADVARREPALRVDVDLLLPPLRRRPIPPELVVAARDPRPAHHQLTGRVAVAREGAAGVGVDRLQLHPELRTTLLGQQAQTLVGREGVVVG